MKTPEAILGLAQKVIDGERISYLTARELAATLPENFPVLLAAAHRIRVHYCGQSVHCCSILNARSGSCSEDCAYCAQSVYHSTGVAVYPLLDAETILARARQAEKNGVSHFSLVTSGRGVDESKETADFDEIIRIFHMLGEQTRLRFCASLGSISTEQALSLKQAGVERYHHNVETSSSYYPAICKTHCYSDRIAAIRAARQGGLSVCSGGIIGMGETLEQRLEMAFELRDLEIDCVPVNILNPVSGTRMERQLPLAPLEILRTLAIFRFILPTAIIRTAGGREKNLRDLQSLALMAGVNGMLTGGYLTTGGRDSHMDRRMIEDLGMHIAV